MNEVQCEWSFGKMLAGGESESQNSLSEACRIHDCVNRKDGLWRPQPTPWEDDETSAILWKTR